MNTIAITPGRIDSPVTHFLHTPDQNAVARTIMECVAHFYGYGYRDMLSRHRTQHIAYARQMAMALVRDNTGLSLHEIAALFARKRHGTIMHASSKIQSWREIDKRTRQDYANLEAVLGSAATIGKVVT